MEDNNNLDRENKIEHGEQKEHLKSGEIRYRLDQKSRIKSGAFQFITLLIVVVVTSVTTATYVSRKIQENPLVIDDNSNFSQMIRKSLDNFGSAIYDRTRIREIYKEVSFSLVGVSTNPELFFGDNYEGIYTGVVINSEGYILVPYDVTTLTDSEIYIRTARENDRIYQADVVGRDTASGLAVLQVEGLGLRPPKFSDSSTVKVAQSVIAMGNPFGDSDRGTLTFGVVSTVNKAYPILSYDNRDVKVFGIETDAKVTPGNNGGVLLNMNGEVVGFNSFRLSNSSSSGLGAAISANEARNIARSLINSGEDLVPFIGIYGDLVTDLEEQQSGFYVQRIAPEGTADRAGLRPTDIILSIDNQPIETSTSIEEYIKTRKVGDVVKIRFRRISEIIEVEATLYGTSVD